MRILSFIALCTFMMAGISVAQENQKFTTKSYVDILPELILMESFSSVEGSHIVFDKPEGRIAESVYISDSVKAGQVEKFYAGILPQLGWTAGNQMQFVRETEQLTIKTSENDGVVTAKFMLSPYSAQNSAK